MAAIDYLILVSYFMLLLMIGGWYRQRNRSMDDFLLGGRQMKSLPVALSLFVSWFSIISYTAIPGELIQNGPMIWSGLLAAPIGLWFVGWVVIPKMRMWGLPKVLYIRPTDVPLAYRVLAENKCPTSAYEIVDGRFGQSTARLGSTLFLLMRIAWMAMIVHIASKVIVAPVAVVRPWCVAMVLIGVTVAYSLGGFRAVVLTDCIQAGIMFGGAIAIIFIVGEGVVWNGRDNAGWLSQNAYVAWPVPKLCDPWARVSLVPAMIGALSLGVCVKTGDQMNVQRFLSVPNIRASRQVLLAGFGFDVLLTALLAVVGLSLLTQSVAVPDADGVLPRFIGSGLPVGVTGLVVAALLAAAMSSISSGLNACVSTVAVDWFQPRRTIRTIDTSRGIAILATVGLGIIIFILSQIIGLVQGNLIELCYKIVNLLATPLGGLVLTALFIPRAHVRAVWLSCFACLGVVVWVTYFSPITFLLASPSGLVAQLTIAFFAQKKESKL